MTDKTYSLNTIFTIVVCGQVFNISWKSLTSDGPKNFFTRHFTKSTTTSRIMHIDRSPDTFKLIIRHLRGYNIQAKDECQHRDLLNDAHYFGLARLLQLLKQFVYLNVGGSVFRLRWDLFDQDGPHNYFTGPLKHSLLSPHPSLGEQAPILIERDPSLFQHVIRHLQGYHVHIEDEQHRLQLLSDAQFYLFRKLRDKLKSNINKQEPKEEVLLHLQDVRPNQIVTTTEEVYYRQGNKSFLLTTQLEHFNLNCHKQEEKKIYLLDTTSHVKLQKDPTWSLCNQVIFDQYCAIVIKEKEEEKTYTLDEYLQQQDWNPCSLHNNGCQTQWLAVEKAIAKVYHRVPTSSSTTTNKLLMVSFQKVQMIGSKLQANMKRDFLSF